jgi:nitrogenase molybdenum-iron protein NifN
MTMAVVVNTLKPLSTCPLKLSAPLGAAMAFMGIEGCLPLLHGSQGCTAFALVMMVRHFREAIPLQTTAMNELSTILGGMDHVEQALVNIAKRTRPKVIGLISTALVATRGEDVHGDLKLILGRNPDLADTRVVYVSAPDYEGSLETGWSKAALRMVQNLAGPRGATAIPPRVNLLPGCHLTPGDVEHLKDIVEAFGLECSVLPDLSLSLDGYVPGSYVPTTLGGTSLDQAERMGGARLTIAVGAHMRPAAEALEQRTGVPSLVFDRLTGLEPCDRLMVALSNAAARPVPEKLRRARSQLVDAMLDGHFFFGGRAVAVAGEPDMIRAMAGLVADMGGSVSAAVTTIAAPGLDALPCERVVIGDFADLEREILDAGGADLVISNANARQLCARLGLPLFRAGFPVFDRLGAAHQTTIGYRGTRDLIAQLGNILMDRPEIHSVGGLPHDPALAAG